MAIEIQRWTLIGLLAYSYLSRVPGLVRQGWIGAPALAIGLLIATILILLLRRSSSGAALFLAAMSGLGVGLRLVGYYVVEPHILGGVRSSPIEVIFSVIVSVVAGFCAMNLWGAWRQKPNQLPEPTITAVTPPADGGDRAGGARGSS
jgi:hypothetical protein